MSLQRAECNSEAGPRQPGMSESCLFLGLIFWELDFWSRDILEDNNCHCNDSSCYLLRFTRCQGLSQVLIHLILTPQPE